MSKPLDRVSEVYAGAASDPVFQRHLRARIHWTCRQVQGRRVLDVGCSQGLVPILLAREGFEVVGIDIEPSAIEQAQATLARENETVRAKTGLVLGDVFTAELELGAFDTVIAGEIMEHLTQPARLAERCRELLVEGGRFIVTVPFGVHPHPDHKTTFYLTALLEALGESFAPVEMELIHTPVNTGGPVPIVGLVARKLAAAAATDPAAMRTWLGFSERAFAASEGRYLAILDSLQQQRASLREQLTTHQQKQIELAAREKELRAQLMTAEKEWQGRLAASEQEHARLTEEWQEKLVEAQQERAQFEQEWQGKLATAQQERAQLEQEWQGKLATAQQERTQSEKEWQGKLATAQQERTRSEQEWQGKLATAQQERTQLEQQSRAQLKTLEKAASALRSERDELTGILGEAEQAVQALTLERDLLRQDLTALIAVEQRLRHGQKERDQLLRQLQRRIAMMEDATSYRLGLLLVRCAQRPYRLLLLPYRVAQLAVAALRRRASRRQGKLEPRLAPLPRDPAPAPAPVTRRAAVSPLTTDILTRLAGTRGKSGTPTAALKPPAASVTTPQPAPVAAAAPSPPVLDDETAKLLLSGLYEDPRRIKDLKVAAIFDEFSLECFRPDCGIITFRPDNWEPILSRERPHLLLVESAWKGNGGAWEYRVAQYNYPGAEELAALVQWCRERGIPSAFWNKEDPVHFDRFIETAKLFDVVFTTDANCIPRYRQAVGHERVYALPFAAQPRLHNPIRVPGYRGKPVCFAGSYYRNRHPKRQEEMDWLLDAAMDFGLEIYDRGYGQKGRGTENFVFPERFAQAIVGGASYREIVKVYKQYRVFLNVNSVTDSPTMFSRRVFELLACGTPVVSTPARGLQDLLGEEAVRVVASRREAEHALRRLLDDDVLRERLGLAGQRLIAGAHTYAHRLQEIASRVGYNIRPPAPPRISAIAWTDGRVAAADLIARVANQEGVLPQLVLVTGLQEAAAARESLAKTALAEHSVVLPSDRPRDGAAWWKEALAEAPGEYVALLSPEDHYGPRYLRDLAWALSCTHAEAVGKAAHFAANDGATPELMAAASENTYVDAVLPAAMLARRELVADLGWLGDALHDTAPVKAASAAGARVFAADRFNYLRAGAGVAAPGVDL